MPSCHAIALASAEAFAKAGHLSRRSLGEGWSLRYLPGRSIERCGATGLDHIITSPQGRTLARHRGEHRRYARCRGDSCVDMERLRAGMALRDLFGLPEGGVYEYNDPRDSVVMGSARGKQADDGIIP
jgi:hypothetical protein